MLRNLARRDQLVAGANDSDVVAQPLERARSGFDHVHPPCRAELRESNARELRRRVREDRQTDAFALEAGAVPR